MWLFILSATVGFLTLSTGAGSGFGGAGLLVRVNQYPRWSWLLPHCAQNSGE
jgi:hypothetical protein